MRGRRNLEGANNRNLGGANNRNTEGTLEERPKGEHDRKIDLWIKILILLSEDQPKEDQSQNFDLRIKRMKFDLGIKILILLSEDRS